MKTLKSLQFYISAIFLSLYSRKFYADIIVNNQRSGFKYLLVLSLFLALPITMEAKSILSGILRDSNDTPVQENLNYIQAQLPELRLKNSKFEIDSKQNVQVTDLSGDPVAIFDVENLVTDLGQYEGVVIIKPEALSLMLPTSSAIMVLDAKDASESLDQYFIAQNGYKKLNSAKLVSDLQNILQTPVILIFIFGALWFFLRYALSAFGYSFIAGMLFSYMLKTNNFSFKQCVRVAAFTSTPVAIMELITIYSGGGLFSYVSLVYFITHILYIHFAVESYKKTYVLKT